MTTRFLQAKHSMGWMKAAMAVQRRYGMARLVHSPNGWYIEATVIRGSWVRDVQVSRAFPDPDDAWYDALEKVEAGIFLSK